MGVTMKHQEEARLQLIRSIREQSRYNSELMNSHHKILAEEVPDTTQEAAAPGSFKLRLLIAVLLFVGFSWLNFTGNTFLSQTAGDYAEAISHDIDINSFDFSALIPYTLDN